VSTLILCPSRGRPLKAVELVESFEQTVDLDQTALLVVMDEDDPMLGAYLELLPARYVTVSETVGNMNLVLNEQATKHAGIGVYTYLGFVGDDHRFRTKDWDRMFEEVLGAAGGGFAYGNDLYQGENLPTHVVMNASIVAALGWMGLPRAKHLYLDNTWKLLGEAVNRLFYFPEVIIEHMHVYAGKSEMDEGYERVNSRSIDAHDRAIFDTWSLSQAHADIERVRQALGI
jgi:hypothetical protein